MTAIASAPFPHKKLRFALAAILLNSAIFSDLLSSGGIEEFNENAILYFFVCPSQFRLRGRAATIFATCGSPSFFDVVRSASGDSRPAIRSLRPTAYSLQPARNDMVATARPAR
jgi:hypothetical protein